MRNLITFIPTINYIISTAFLITPFFVEFSETVVNDDITISPYWGILYVLGVLYWFFLSTDFDKKTAYISNVLRLETKNKKDIYFYKFDNTSDKLRIYKFNYLSGFIEEKFYILSLHKDISTKDITNHLEYVINDIEKDNQRKISEKLLRSTTK